MRKLNILTVKGATALTKPGRHADGGGLYLNITKTGAKSWVWLGLVRGGKRVEVGLGSFAVVGLAEAREKAAEARALAAQGKDPRTARDILADEPEPHTPRFGDFAEAYIEDHRAGWKNPKHLYQWRTTLSVQRDKAGNLIDTGFCLTLRDKPLDEIDTESVLAVLKPIWSKKMETAKRLQGRLERILDAAHARGLRSGENPARWKGHLQALLPPKKKLTRGHLAAMPYADVPAYFRELMSNDSASCLALAFTILTACRSGEVRGARWSEIDEQARTWTVPADRMKAKKAHVVPLSDAAVEVLRRVRGRHGDLVFPNPSGRVFSDMALAGALKRTGGKGVTVHGFRSSFRDWAGDMTPHPRDVVEQCLAHQIANEVERAYRRSDALEKRRAVMADWSDFVTGARPGNVISLNLGKSA